MVNFNYDIDNIKFIRAVTEGVPGNRIFSIELYTAEINIKIIIEKEQLIAVCEYIIRNLYNKNIPELPVEFGFESDFDEEYRSNDLSIEILEESQQFQLYFRNQEDEGISNQIIIKISYEQAINFAKSSINLSSKGRPVCKLCHRPMNQNDISSENPLVCINCPRKNGHHKN